MVLLLQKVVMAETAQHTLVQLMQVAVVAHLIAQVQAKEALAVVAVGGNSGYFTCGQAVGGCGQPNTGGGGGGAAAGFSDGQNISPGSGGSGVVVVRYTRSQVGG
jgi:hypothetical protein